MELYAGAGDSGLDIVATVDATGTWDNYQCKRYETKLAPHHVWLEIGKIVYHSWKGEYTVPRRSYFVSPKGSGPALLKLLKKPDEIRKGLIQAWDEKCRDSIGSTPVECDGSLLEYIQKFDFSIFATVEPLALLRGHAATRWHAIRFGGGLPLRPPPPPHPASPQPTEAIYVSALCDAYGQHLGTQVTVQDLATYPDLDAHFRAARMEFYSAEALRAFSRDTLPPGQYESLQMDFEHGIGDELRGHHPDGYRRVVAVVKLARQLLISHHPLHTRVGLIDRGGICHQLANESRLRWVR